MEIDYFLEHLSRLDNVHQWEERDSIIKESVSQHSFKVSAITHYVLSVMENEIDKEGYLNIRLPFAQFKADCLSYAILHDFDEAIIGRDISHVVKYNSYNGEKIREAINNFVNYQETLDFQGLLPQPTGTVKKLVKLCDWVALITFCKRNSNLGCPTFDAELRYCLQNIEKSIEVVAKLIEKDFGFDCAEMLNKIFIDNNDK